MIDQPDLKYCEVCGKTFELTLKFCPNDGTPLVSVEGLVGQVLDGRYRIESLIGSGGMSAVYRATHIHILKPVAVKVLHQDFALNEYAIERFRREAIMTARLNHPNAIHVMDFGVTAERIIYFVMELVDGKTLRQLIEAEGKFDYRRAVALLRQVCDAVEAAHREGIIHRDLKPDNIMIQLAGEVERVKVLDFGIAKLKEFALQSLGQNVERSNLTRAGMLVGTPQYMSPEQCRGQELDVRSDIYSLGIVLYEMLCGQPPFTTDSQFLDLLSKQLNEIPRPLREVAPTIPAAIERVVMQALEKDPERRQPSVSELSLELERAVAESSFRMDVSLPSPVTDSTLQPGGESRPGPSPTLLSPPEPTAPSAPLAHPESGSDQPAVSRTGDLSSPAAPPTQVKVAGEDLSPPEKQELAPKPPVRNQIFISYSDKDQEWLEKLQIHLKPLVRKHKIILWDDTQMRTGLLGQQRIATALAPVKVAVLLVSPNFLDSDFIAEHELPPLLEAAEKEGLTILWAAVSACMYQETEIVNYAPVNNPDRPLDSLDDWELNKELVIICHKINQSLTSTTQESSGYGGTSLLPNLDSPRFPPPYRADRLGEDETLPDPAEIHLPTGLTLRHRLLAQSKRIGSVCWTSDGRTLVAASADLKLRFWSVEGGCRDQALESKFSRAFDAYIKELGLERSVGRVRSLAWSPDGRMLAFSAITGAVQLWDAASPDAPLRTLDGHNGRIYTLAWSPDSKVLASGSRDNTICLWDVATGRLQHTLTGHRRAVYSVALSPDGKVLASASKDRTVCLWETQNWQLRRTLEGHTSGVASVAWSPDGKILATASFDDTVRIWERWSAKQRAVLKEHTGSVYYVTFSPDGRFLASKSSDHTIRLWDCERWRTVAVLDEPWADDHDYWPAGPVFHPSRPLLLTLGMRDSEAHLYDLHPEAMVADGPPSGGLRPRPQPEGLTYVCAKIVMVGESNVGKSCLAMRLANDAYAEQGTTHGMRFWKMKPEGFGPVATPEGERREVVLWDMGGQDEYRLVHQLFLDETMIALILFDPTRGRIAFDEVAAWNKRLERQLQKRQAVKLLVGTKLDEGGESIDQARVQRLIKDYGFVGYFPTSAKTARGLEALKAAIAQALDWERLGKISRPDLFQQIRDEIEQKREAGQVFLLYDELERSLQRQHPALFDPQAIEAVVEQLSLQGLIADACLASGKRALVLQIEQIERYAGSIIIAARNHPRGVPAIEVRRLASSNMVFPRIKEEERLPLPQEHVVLECVVQLLLEHGICFHHEGLLIFPSEFQPTEQEGSELLPQATSLYYDFSGAINNIYASLVTSLAISGRVYFGRMRLWESRAEFALEGQGACGLRKVERRDGEARLDVYFTEDTPPHLRRLFISFIADHLQQHGVEMVEHLEIKCACGYVFAEEIVRKRLAKGITDVVCPDCEHRTQVEGRPKEGPPARGLGREATVLRAEIEEKRREEIAKVKRTFDQPKVSEEALAPVRILHLSDLHITSEADVTALLQPLVADLRDWDGGPSIQSLDYLVVSGDLTHRAEPAEFERARDLISAVIAHFKLSAERCLIVPGNHDLSWVEQVYDWKGRFPNDTEGLEEGDYIEQPAVLGLRNPDRYWLRFRDFSAHFYHQLMQQEYPLQVEEQAISVPCFENGLQFLLLNSSWRVDQFFRERSGINLKALTRGLFKADEQVRSAVDEGRLAPSEPLLRIAVWHHPITGNKKIVDDAFLGLLKQAGFQVCLHGHVHENRAELINFLHPTRHLHVVGAGSFGAPKRGRPESVPRLYNLLEVTPDRSQIRVHTRGLRKGGGAWEAWAEWPGLRQNERLAYYDVKLQPKLADIIPLKNPDPKAH